MKQNKIFLIIPGVLTIVVIIIHFIQSEFGINLNGLLGLKPRRLEGLLGVFFSPFLHGSFDHLFNNIISFFFLLSALYFFYKPIANKTLLWGWLITGTWTWVFAIGGNHVGASGIIYFLVVFLFVSGLLRMEKGLIAVSLAVCFYHAGIIWGVVPWEELLGDDMMKLSFEQQRSIAKVSWESHLMGALSGLVLAFYLKKDGPQKQEIPMVDDISKYEEKYGKEYWDVNKQTVSNKSPFVIKYVYVKTPKSIDEDRKPDLEDSL